MQCPETQEALHVRDDISISHGSIPKEHRGTGRILEVLAVDEKPSLLSAVLHHVDELRRVVHGHVVLDGLLDLSRLHWLEALGSHHILEKQLASLLEHALDILIGHLLGTLQARDEAVNEGQHVRRIVHELAHVVDDGGGLALHRLLLLLETTGKERHHNGEGRSLDFLHEHGGSEARTP